MPTINMNTSPRRVRDVGELGAGVSVTGVVSASVSSTFGAVETEDREANFFFFHGLTSNPLNAS